MDSLPLELHAQIFEFACTDDGTTARALSLVSHYIREVAAPFLYQSLSISGLKQMNDLCERLATTPPHLRRIRHLFLSDWTAADVRKHTSAPSDMERYDAERSFAARILALAAPTLEALTLVVSCPFTAPPLIGELFATPFPRLADLAVHGFYPFPHTPGALPALRSLRLSGHRNPHGLFQLGSLAAAAPRLTHLRLSDIAAAAPFARELHAAALPHDPSSAAATATGGGVGLAPALPPSLKHVAIDVRRLQQGVHFRGTLTRGLANAHDKMLALLREVELRRGDTALDAFAVAESDGWEMYGELRREWLVGLGIAVEQESL
ncbi:uncharacterized protein BXZ73DRAFT_55780 [Epithele typhae]|uniref:uncharacterized protein n=1 Tax=Epithele typhae TaxID=378194 RepID=UPI00200749EA|nr:uncharacterized protein BXZ73DRAFT_55780 [Epithele typhae]KAH9912972.1 hypothetical protein BXZ73DRAFT_55780 [Epithele typhae]